MLGEPSIDGRQAVEVRDQLSVAGWISGIVQKTVGKVEGPLADIVARNLIACFCECLADSGGSRKPVEDAIRSGVFCQLKDGWEYLQFGTGILETLCGRNIHELVMPTDTKRNLRLGNGNSQDMFLKEWRGRLKSSEKQYNS